MITVEQLSQILYSIDPMNTTCRSNKGMENEYDTEAWEIVNLIKDGAPFKQAYYQVMSENFWVARVLSAADEFFKVELEYYGHCT